MDFELPILVKCSVLLPVHHKNIFDVSFGFINILCVTSKHIFYLSFILETSGGGHETFLNKMN
jgi:hypothetical protein